MMIARFKLRAGVVRSFSASDFARTLTSNGDGSDHAWGGVQPGDMTTVFPHLDRFANPDMGFMG